MKKQLQGFMDFVRAQGVIGLAIGLAIGTQAGDAVKAIVENFINPIVGFIIGGNSLDSIRWDIVGKQGTAWFELGDRSLSLGIGAILSSLLTLLAVAAVIYFVVRGLRLDKLDKKKED